MVFFTCSACGSSLKKNQVEKHYQNECPRCEVLSCMDCGKDFYGDEYASHTKCISEAEKYQGSLFKESGKAGGEAKGEKKQHEWLERVQELVVGAKVNPRITRLLERVANYPNIPRKKAKFENFVKNSISVRDEQTLGQLWDLFSSAIKPPTEPGDQNTAKEEKEDSVEHNESSGAMNESDCKDDVDEGDFDTAPPKKKKKSKRQCTDQQELDVCEASDVKLEHEAQKPKKKKRKREKRLQDEITSVEEIGTNPDLDRVAVSQVEETALPPVKKKRKRKHRDTENEIEACDDVEIEKESGSASEVKVKVNGAIGSAGEDQGEDPAAAVAVAKKKKKKRKNRDEAETSQKSPADEQSEGDSKMLGVGPMEVALQYINIDGVEPTENGEGLIERGVDKRSKKKVKKRKCKAEDVGEAVLVVGGGKGGVAQPVSAGRKVAEKSKMHKTHKH